MRTKMRYRDVAHVHIVADGRQRLGALMQGEFVTPEVDVYPTALFAITGLAAQYVDIELLRRR